MFSLKGKTAVVTGASRGIGQSVALALAEAGANVALWARSEDALKETARGAEKFGVRALAIPTDITSTDSVEAAMRRSIESFGSVEIGVINAGVQNLKPFLEFDEADWRALIDTNIYGALRTARVLGRHMTERGGGSVIAMASIYSFVGAAGNSLYAMSKGALMQLTKALAIEWSRANIRVNAICPGWIETALTTPYMQDEKVLKAGLRQIPLHRFGKPDDIGPAAVYLASDEASFVTGQAIIIDGGQTTR